MGEKIESRRGVFAVIEGLTGVGKSTASRLVAERLGMTYIAPMAPEFVDARNMLDNDPRSLDARYALYFSAILHAGAVIAEKLESGEHVITDSWVYRTHATHQALGSRLVLKAPAWLPEPEVKILLTCDEGERIQRIDGRATSSSFWKERCEDVGPQIEAWYRDKIKKLIEVRVSYGASTRATIETEKTPEQLSIDRMVGDVVSKIRPAIKKREETLIRTEVPTERYFLQIDLDDLDHRIEHTKELIREAKLLGQESTEQSSESWHDNYNFEESQRNLRMFQNLLGTLSNAREKAVVVNPNADADSVSLGHAVVIRQRGSERTEEIHVGSYMVGDKLRKLGFISYDAPVAKGLLGASIGSQTSVILDGERSDVEVVSFGVSPRLNGLF